MTLLPAHRRRQLRTVLAWLALAAAGRPLLSAVPHEHAGAHDERSQEVLVTASGEAGGCGERHLHPVVEAHELTCSACTLVHGKSFQGSPPGIATRLVVVRAGSPPASPAPDRRSLAPLPARGPPAA